MHIQFTKSDTDAVAHLLNSRHFLDYCLCNGAVIHESKTVQEAVTISTDNIMAHIPTIIAEISLYNRIDTPTVDIFSIAGSDGDDQYGARFVVIRAEKETYLVGWFHASNMCVIASNSAAHVAGGHLINYFNDINWACFDASPFSNTESFN